MLAGYDHLIAAARRLQWDAEAIELARDAARIPELPAFERATLAQLVGGFWVAEHAVAAELAPFLAAAEAGSARECFSIQGTDEARHARFFDRVAGEVLGADPPVLRAAAGARIVSLFDRELPAAARALARDPRALPGAVALYHLVLEGIVFAVGQDALAELVQRVGGLPGVGDGAARVQNDERWHVGLGVLALQRLGAPVDVADRAAAAATAWSPAIATPERVARVMGAHERRLSIAGVTSPQASGPATSHVTVSATCSVASP